MGLRLRASIAGLAAAGILTATAATRLPAQDTAQLPSVEVNRTTKSDRMRVSGGSTIIVKTARIRPASETSAAMTGIVSGCETSVSPLADRSAGRHLRHCDT
jgi:hypothetical protein